MQLPRAAADSLELVAGVVIKGLARLGACLAGNQWPAIFTVDRVRGQWAADEPGDRGQEVDGAEQLMAGAVGRNLAGPAHDAWDANTAFECGEFALAERTGAASVVTV